MSPSETHLNIGFVMTIMTYLTLFLRIIYFGWMNPSNFLKFLLNALQEKLFFFLLETRFWFSILIFKFTAVIHYSCLFFLISQGSSLYLHITSRWPVLKINIQISFSFIRMLNFAQAVDVFINTIDLHVDFHYISVFCEERKWAFAY